MTERHFPAYKQLLSLHYLLAFLSSAKIYWYDIWIWGDIIKIKTEPPKGEIETRIFYVHENGEVGDNEFPY